MLETQEPETQTRVLECSEQQVCQNKPANHESEPKAHWQEEEYAKWGIAAKYIPCSRKPETHPPERAPGEKVHVA